jgi:hypothetical protein
MTGWMWVLVAVGIAALGGMIAYGMRQSDEYRQDRKRVRRTEEATRKLHDDVSTHPGS